MFSYSSGSDFWVSILLVCHYDIPTIKLEAYRLSNQFMLFSGNKIPVPLLFPIFLKYIAQYLLCYITKLVLILSCDILGKLFAYVAKFVI